MNSSDKFWLGFWMIFGAVLITFISTIGYYGNLSNERYYEAWIACVNTGGEPTTATMQGSTSTTFTCVRK